MNIEEFEEKSRLTDLDIGQNEGLLFCAFAFHLNHFRLVNSARNATNLTVTLSSLSAVIKRASADGVHTARPVVQNQKHHMVQHQVSFYAESGKCSSGTQHYDLAAWTTLLWDCPPGEIEQPRNEINVRSNNSGSSCFSSLFVDFGVTKIPRKEASERVRIICLQWKEAARQSDLELKEKHEAWL